MLMPAISGLSSIHDNDESIVMSKYGTVSLYQNKPYKAAQLNNKFRKKSNTSSFKTEDFQSGFIEF